MSQNHPFTPPDFLHQTDLFRPHNDPDDHWDLACAFAIAKLRRASLKGILIDYPPSEPILMHKSDPDLGSVAQLSYLTKNYPPVAIGHPDFFSERGNILKSNPPGGVQFLLEMLRGSVDGLYIVAVGSARELAEAITREPELFRQKCRGIYLNIGNGMPDSSLLKDLEWNVILDPSAYARIFEAPCPIFWMPCLDDENRVASLESREYGTHFHFRQKDILDHLPKELRNYFAWMFAKETSSRWLEVLGDDFEQLLAVKGEEYRMMYSTASFFDLAGWGVTVKGDLLPKTEEHDWVYRFEPVNVTCTVKGITTWKPATGQTNRYLFHILNTEAYPSAMTLAMKSLLKQLL